MSPTRPVSRSRTARARPDEVATAVDAFRRILRVLRRAARRTELTTGLSAAQTFVLNAVEGAPGCSLNDVAAMTMTDRTSVAAIVERLVDERYLKRAQAEDDRRRASLTVTARGQRAVRESPPPPTILLVDAIRALSASDRRALSRGLWMLTERMGVADEPAGMLFDDGRANGARKRRR